MKRPAFQWYPGDHRRDAGVSACSFEARSLWREMMDLMHDGDPYGHLTAGGVPTEPHVLARMCGVSVKKTKKWLIELEAHNVFSRTQAGVIFSRRMVRDEQLRQRRGAGGVKSLENPNVPRPKDRAKDTFDSSFPHSIDPPLASAVALASASASAKNPHNTRGHDSEWLQNQNHKSAAMRILTELRDARVETRTSIGIHYNIEAAAIKALSPEARYALKIIGGPKEVANADGQRWNVLLGQFAAAYAGNHTTLPIDARGDSGR